MSGSKSTSESQNTSGQNVWGGQSPYLESLYGGAAGAVGGANNNIAGMNPAMMESWQNIMNPGVNPQLQAYQSEVSRNLNENLLPSITSGATMAGGMGGGRQGVAEGVAVRGANEDITNMAGNLYNQDMNRMIQGMGMGSQVANLGLSPYSSLAAILGNPAILGKSQGTSNSKSVSGGVS